jgi:hypothetical protein
MKSIIIFLKNLFRKTEKNIDHIDIKIEILDTPKNVEIYQEIRDDHEKNLKEEKPKRRKKVNTQIKKTEESEAPVKKVRKKKSE